MIERDDHIPPLEELCAELGRARALCAQTLAEPHPAAAAGASAPGDAHRRHGVPRGSGRRRAGGAA
jgi:hypothetical protein